MNQSGAIEVRNFPETRRWSSAAAQREDGGRYYSFQEWIDHCEGDEKAAKDLWNQAWSEEMEQLYWNRKLEEMKGDVNSLDLVFPEQLLEAFERESRQGNVVLQYVNNGSNGNSLRAGDEGQMELGGAGSRAQLTLEILEISTDSCSTEIFICKVRLSCEASPCDGKYLRVNMNGFDFLGAPETSEVIFHMFFGGLLKSQALLYSIRGQLLGLFTLRWAWDPAWARRQWQEKLVAQASLKASNDERFSGMRYHEMDISKSRYTFPEWIQFITQHGWGGPFRLGAQTLAEHVWLHECVVDDVDDDWLQVKCTDCIMQDAMSVPS
jgi:hypothetical protein